MAEAIFTDLARRDGTLSHFEVSSAGTKYWDVGLRPDYRTQKILAEHNIPLDPGKRAQMITERDMKTSDFLIAMSERVANDLGNDENVHLLLNFVESIEDKNIPDPYPTDTFPDAFELIKQGIEGFYYYLKKNSLEK